MNKLQTKPNPPEEFPTKEGAELPSPSLPNPALKKEGSRRKFLAGGVRAEVLHLILSTYLKQEKPKHKPLCEQGFTILESLMAMIIIALVVVLITPSIFMTVASRVQNRRAEQAMQLAQGEIDRVRVLVEQGNYAALTDLPAVAANVAEAPAPITVFATMKTANTSCTNRYTNEQVPATAALPVDINNDCKTDFLVQTFRDQGVVFTPTVGLLAGQQVVMASQMGVRVYAAVAQPQIGSLEVQPANLRFTTGLGQQQRRPLAVLYSRVARSDSDLSLCRYKQSINPAATCID